MPFSVSKTPTPCSAAASKYGRPSGFSISSIDSRGRMFRRSRLLYWKTIGTWSRVSPISARFTLRLLMDSRLASSMTRLGVGDEHHAVHRLQHQLAGRVVEDLAGDGVELEPDLHPADDPDVEGKQVEEERAVGLGLEAHHLAPRPGRRLLVDVLEVGGLTAQARTVVHDLGRQLHRRVVEEHHGAGSLACRRLRLERDAGAGGDPAVHVEQRRCPRGPGAGTRP